MAQRLTTKKLLLVTLTSLAAIGLRGQDLDAVSGTNCTFKANPNKFLGQKANAEKSIRAQIAAMDQARKGVASVAAAKTLDPSTVPHANFIDDQIFPAMAAAGVNSAPIAGDEEFFRRINLDLTGRIPASADIRAFEADSTPNKRAILIDKLLASPAFTDKWTMWMGDLLQNNATAVAINRGVNGRNAFYNYIFNSVQAGQPIREMAYEVVTATGNSFDSPSPAGFILNGFAPGGPTQDTYDMSLVKTASTFLGLSHYDCLLCHNGRGHLDALSVWGAQSTRAQAEQMAAFFARVNRPLYTFPAGTSNADQQASYYYQSWILSDNATSAYGLPTTYGNRPNRALIGTQNTALPIYRTGETPPTAAWRAEFATLMVNDPMFNINFANRLWKAMFNLGQVDSVDTLDPARLDPDNPPAAPWSLQAYNPALLKQLGDVFAAGNYDLRGLLRFIANSNAYQLSSTYPDTWDPNNIGLFARHYPRRMMGEEIHDAIAQSTGVFAKYTPRGFTTTVQWAMQMPDTSEPSSNTNNASGFMNYFLRGNRDNVPRMTDPTILQSGALMNDTFVVGKFHMTQSPVLQGVAKLTTPAAQVQELYLTYLSRLPSDAENTAAVAYLNAAGTTAAAKNAALEDLVWSLMNKLEFVFSY